MAKAAEGSYVYNVMAETGPESEAEDWVQGAGSFTVDKDDFFGTGKLFELIRSFLQGDGNGGHTDHRPLPRRFREGDEAWAAGSDRGSESGKLSLNKLLAIPPPGG